jgi:hypothetical protein
MVDRVTPQVHQVLVETCVCRQTMHYLSNIHLHAEEILPMASRKAFCILHLVAVWLPVEEIWLARAVEEDVLYHSGVQAVGHLVAETIGLA